MHPAFEVIARISRKDPASLGPEQRLDQLGLNSSMGLGVLRSALQRKFSVSVASLGRKMTIGEVIGLLDRTGVNGVAAAASPALRPVTASAPRPVAAAAIPPVTSPPSPPLPALPAHGVDLEEIASLPPWPPDGDGRSFYEDHFTADELAQAGAHPSPPEHLCGIWCAKEAVKKCSAELMSLNWRDIEISGGPGGIPSVRLTPPAPWQFSLSISHTAAYAVASVLAWKIDG
jgi:holo-[acyl-carrier protein] synthase